MVREAFGRRFWGNLAPVLGEPAGVPSMARPLSNRLRTLVGRAWLGKNSCNLKSGQMSNDSKTHCSGDDPKRLASVQRFGHSEEKQGRAQTAKHCKRRALVCCGLHVTFCRFSFQSQQQTHLVIPKCSWR